MVLGPPKLKGVSHLNMPVLKKVSTEKEPNQKVIHLQSALQRGQGKGLDTYHNTRGQHVCKCTFAWAHLTQQLTADMCCIVHIPCCPTILSMCLRCYCAASHACTGKVHSDH